MAGSENGAGHPYALLSYSGELVDLQPVDSLEQAGIDMDMGERILAEVLETKARLGALEGDVHHLKAARSRQDESHRDIAREDAELRSIVQDHGRRLQRLEEKHPHRFVDAAKEQAPTIGGVGIIFALLQLLEHLVTQ